MKTRRNCTSRHRSCSVCTVASVAGSPRPATLTRLQAAIGHWQVINDEGKPGGQVETYLVDGKLFGKVTQLRPGRQPGDLCDKCPGELKNKPILGMVILRNFSPDGDVWVGGTVVDPENGKEYTRESLDRRVMTSYPCAALSASRCWDAPKPGPACPSPRSPLHAGGSAAWLHPFSAFAAHSSSLAALAAVFNQDPQNIQHNQDIAQQHQRTWSSADARSPQIPPAGT